MGPVARCVGSMTAPEQIWQDPVPAHEGPLLDAAGADALKASILASGLSHQELIKTAWASASTFRHTDFRGGSNGARVRLAPQKDWEVNEPAMIAKATLPLTLQLLIHSHIFPHRMCLSAISFHRWSPNSMSSVDPLHSRMPSFSADVQPSRLLPRLVASMSKSHLPRDAQTPLLSRPTRLPLRRWNRRRTLSGTSSRLLHKWWIGLTC